MFKKPDLGAECRMWFILPEVEYIVHGELCLVKTIIIDLFDGGLQCRQWVI